MKTRILLLAALAAMAFAAISCSKDDDPSDPSNKVPDPEGTVLLNMMNTNNGSTVLPGGPFGSPYIRIDDANNFYQYDNLHNFIDLGAMKGLGNITKFTTEGAGLSCAVVPGHGYLMYRVWRDTGYHVGDPIDLSPAAGYRQFPSGRMAYSVQWTYRVYVDSWILSVFDTILGAKVKFQMPFNPYGLPLTLDELKAIDAKTMETRGWEMQTREYKNNSGQIVDIYYYVRCENMFTGLTERRQ